MGILVHTQIFNMPWREIQIQIRNYTRRVSSRHPRAKDTWPGGHQGPAKSKRSQSQMQRKTFHIFWSFHARHLSRLSLCLWQREHDLAVYFAFCQSFSVFKFWANK